MTASEKLTPTTRLTQSSSARTTSSSSPPAKSAPAVQFVHESCFATVKAAKSKWNASDVVKESLRARGHCAHVAVPVPPICHFGIEPGQLQSWLLGLEAIAKSELVSYARGQRRQRSDTPILVGTVVSIPRPPAEREDADCVKWRDATIAWARGRYGDKNIASVLEHTDEAFQHLHIFVHNNGRSVKPLMAGHAAVQAAIAADVAKELLGKAYRAGCQRLQDDYWQEVGRHSGLLRISDQPRPRRSRAGHQAVLAKELDDELAAAKQAATEAKALELEWGAHVARAVGERKALASAQGKAQDRESEFAAKIATANEMLKRLSPDERQELKQSLTKCRR